MRNRGWQDRQLQVVRPAQEGRAGVGRAPAGRPAHHGVGHVVGSVGKGHGAGAEHLEVPAVQEEEEDRHGRQHTLGG